MKDMKTYKIFVRQDINLTKQDIDDIMMSALYSIKYWCNKVISVGNIHCEYMADQVSRGGVLELCTRDGNVVSLTLRKFLCGVQQWFSKSNGNQAVYNNVLDCYKITAKDADAIIQYALFDRIVYRPA